MKSKVVAKLTAGLLLGFISAVVVWFLAEIFLPGLFYSFEARTYDTRVSEKIVDVKSQSIDEIIIIDIDGRSVSEMGKFYQWSRSVYPRIIKYLNEGGAMAIGLDILFDRDMREPQADLEFIREVKNAGNVFNAIYFEKEDSISWRYRMTSEPEGFDWQRHSYILPENVTSVLRNEERIGSEFIELLNASLGIGHANFQGDVDGVVRKMHLFSIFNGHAYPSLSLKMFLTLLGVDSIDVKLGKQIELFSAGNKLGSIPIDDQGAMIINYAGNFQTFRYIPFYDVLEKRVPKEYFKDKIVFIGTSLAGLFDLRSAPFNPAFPGVEIHANILHTLLNANFITELSPLQAFLILALIGMGVGIVISFLSPTWSIIVIFLVGLINTFTALHLFLESNIWIPVVNPILALVFTFSLSYLYRYITEEKGKKFIKETFSHFVTHSVVEELLANPEKIKLGGEKKECTVFFSDVSGFTTIAEQLTPEALVRLLNEYLTQMTNIVFKYDGMLDKYEGDAIMAVFGAPISHGNHAAKACAAALEMQETLVKLREMWSRQGRPQLHARCGINTGIMVVGNMGSESRFDYTVMGDAVNLGARLEPANKQYRTRIMIGETTYTMAGDEIIARELDLLRVKGKTEPVRVYELVGTKEKGLPDKKAKTIELFNQGFESYLKQNWESSARFFKEALNVDPTDGPSRTYIKRCEQFAKQPPGSDWDGVFILHSK